MRRTSLLLCVLWGAAMLGSWPAEAAAVAVKAKREAGVPEPATWLSLVGGLGLTGAWLLRRLR